MNLDNADAIDLMIINRGIYYIKGNGRFAPFPSMSLFAQIEDGNTITNTTDELSMLGAGVGTLSVPPNGFKVGDSFHAKLGGLMSCVSNEDIDIRIKSGNVILVDTGLLNLAVTTNKAWELEIDFTIRSLGGAGEASIKTNGQFVHNKNANNVYEGISFNDVNDTTFDTTIQNTLDITIEWGSATTSNSIVCSSFVLYRTFFGL